MSIKRSAILSVVVFLIALYPVNIFAQRGGGSRNTIEVKIASPLPRDSPWGKTLDQIGAEWSRITNGEVRPRILHNGQEGGEGKMITSLSSNNIQTGLFTSFGISTIYPPIMTLSVPFLIRDDAELDAVLKEILPQMDAQVNKTDYVIIAWSKVGWVNVFSKDPVMVPNDLRRMKIATNAETKDLNTVFKTMGFQMVETEITDTGTKVVSGAINSIYNNPAAVAAFQLHQSLKNMMSMPIAPAMGAIVMNRVTWNKISPASQQAILSTTRRIAQNFDASVTQNNTNAIQSMVRGGLIVNRPTAANEELWRAEIERALPPLLGTTFDRDVYQKINDVLTAYRNR
ncbi:hypothetical protein AGMMS49928_07820 [Spirochaetia bacterium]|nr:hypothetical protein AGMMS49928_07820 [Spirochaetia bacterium]